MSPPHWAVAWLGRAYHPETGHCAALVHDVQRLQFGRDLPPLPSPSPALRGRIAQVQAECDARWRPVDPPADGDVVLMRRAARHHHVGHHVGVLAVRDGTPHVLHALAGLGACLHPLGRLHHYGLDVVGYYRPTSAAPSSSTSIEEA